MTKLLIILLFIGCASKPQTNKVVEFKDHICKCSNDLDLVFYYDDFTYKCGCTKKGKLNIF